MANPFFRFKQFIIRHDRCAMKVGTDGVLLGAWADHHSPENILDIGTGSGLIALMLAQRFPAAKITGLEINAEAAGQATENALESPFSERLQIVHTSLQSFTTAGSYDLIVSNPPFFKVTSSSLSEDRNQSRQFGHLEPAELIRFAAKHLNPGGKLALIFPAETNLESLAEQYGLYTTRKTMVKGTPERNPKRILREFSASRQPSVIGELVIETARNQYTEAFRILVKDFYLSL